LIYFEVHQDQQCSIKTHKLLFIYFVKRQKWNIKSPTTNPTQHKECKYRTQVSINNYIITPETIEELQKKIVCLTKPKHISNDFRFV